jgi:hypothetical protein
MKRMLVIGAIVAALSGCLNVETEISLDDDGSGSIDLVYAIDRSFYELGVFDDSDVALPIPISEDEFREAVRLHRGLRLRRYRKREEENVIVVEARIDFESVAALSAWYGGSSDGEGAISLSEEGGNTQWRQLLYPGGGANDEIALALGESLQGFALSYTLRPPGEIVSAAPGEISSDRRRATVTVPLEQIVTATEPVYWNVRW